MKQWLKNIFRDKKQEEIEALKLQNSIRDAMLVALARLMFVKPETMIREVNNYKANGEYYTNLLKARNKYETGNLGEENPTSEMG